MTVNELIESLQNLDDKDKIVIIGDEKIGWSNIEELKENQCTISILEEKYPVFSQGD